MKQLFLYSLTFCMILITAAECVAKEGKSSKNAECKYKESHVNETTGSVIKIMEREQLLNHLVNNSGSKQIDDSFTALAHLANYNNSIVLYLSFNILSPEAKKNYGSIYEGDKLLLKTKDEDIITLESGKSDVGHLNNLVTTYTVFYPLSKSIVEKLKVDEIAKARIHWSNGYVDYEVDNRDFFIRQLTCVE